MNQLSGILFHMNLVEADPLMAFFHRRQTFLTDESAIGSVTGISAIIADHAEFIQIVRVDVIVDAGGSFESNVTNPMENSIYDAEKPYGPFTCTVCGKEYDELR